MFDQTCRGKTTPELPRGVGKGVICLVAVGLSLFPECMWRTCLIWGVGKERRELPPSPSCYWLGCGGGGRKAELIVSHTHLLCGKSSGHVVAALSALTYKVGIV